MHVLPVPSITDVKMQMLLDCDKGHAYYATRTHGRAWCRTLAECYSKHVAHHVVNPCNVFMSSMHVTLLDT
jgi:hypothetical protein